MSVRAGGALRQIFKISSIIQLLNKKMPFITHKRAHNISGNCAVILAGILRVLWVDEAMR